MSKSVPGWRSYGNMKGKSKKQTLIQRCYSEIIYHMYWFSETNISFNQVVQSQWCYENNATYVKYMDVEFGKRIHRICQSGQGRELSFVPKSLACSPIGDMRYVPGGRQSGHYLNRI